MYKINVGSKNPPIFSNTFNTISLKCTFLAGFLSGISLELNKKSFILIFFKLYFLKSTLIYSFSA